MQAVDIREAFDGNGDWFTCRLLRLIAKSDGENRAKLAKGFPVEVKAVEIYQNWCPYKDVACTEVDWEEIARRAEQEAG